MIKSAAAGKPVSLRNPKSVEPVIACNGSCRKQLAAGHVRHTPLTLTDTVSLIDSLDYRFVSRGQLASR